MEIRKLNAARGWTWVKQGFQLILRNPMMTISSALGGMMLVLMSMLIPGIGPVLAIVMLPFFLAGYMALCRALEEEETFNPALALAVLKRNLTSFISLGSLLLIGLFLISALMMQLGGETFAKLMQDMPTMQDPQQLMQAISAAGPGVAMAILSGFSLMLLLMVTWQYAPILVFFSGISPFAALRASLAGTLRNVLPYTVYGLVMQLIALVLGILPYNLGMIALMPLTLTSLYVSYRNIFPWLDVVTEQPAAPQTEG